ncbi:MULTISPECIES: HesB/IscA family protein [Bacillati]|nr:iron-sulfur cluster assembly accessory protein [Brochothrix thermosphacta]SPN74828.1 putative chaperone involved in Fe-S cluster assembly [Brochothrix thermosphacta]SPP27799.1 putative chaperone involved in Fe-S cluster assembly [Brochothrix thermosphacta]HCZ38070.1 iron-sulfur cluster assembly accessory protein [Brochothrix thermosphacta]HCZ46745.1 iron-sulfur cluster assembly accessory protein [Brochothrix thermosphacta]
MMTTERTVDFTENAQKEIRDAMKKNELEGYAFNLYLERNEYGGLGYGMQLTDEQVADDVEETFEGFVSVVRKEDVPFLAGTTVDYGVQHGSEGFIIDNPNIQQQQSGCGCGGHGHDHDHGHSHAHAESGCGCGGHGHGEQHTHAEEQQSGCGCGGHGHSHAEEATEERTCKCGRKDGSNPNGECQCQKEKA